MTVTKLDGSTESVFVRVLPVREFPRLLSTIEDESSMAEVFCAQPPGWADQLNLESVESIVLKGEKLNGDFFGRWAQRRLARQERIMPGITERLVLSQAQPALPNTSPK